MSRQEKALDIAEYAIGAPLFVVVATATALVMAVGFGALETINWLRDRA
jgi:hypothetical protein